jgi:hypothetical protein
MLNGNDDVPPDQIPGVQPDQIPNLQVQAASGWMGWAAPVVVGIV